MKAKLFATFVIFVVLLVSVVPAVFSAPAVDQGEPDLAAKPDNRVDPMTTKQLEMREKALEAKLNGKAYGHTHAVAKGQYVELERVGEDPVWTVLGEFGDFPHNNIAEPDRGL